jgi:hypothetical protein
MESDLAARGAGGDRIGVAELAANRLGAQRDHSLLSAIRSGKGPDLRAPGHQALDQPAADEAGSPGDKRGRHLLPILMTEN